MITFVPTPIGNLEDISFRSLQALKDAELILCEDTRVTKQLLTLLTQKLHFLIDQNKKFISLHSHNEDRFLTAEYKDILIHGKVVYVSDAGMPCVSDPGAFLVDFCIQNNIPYDVLPGANALLVAYAMSGFPQKEFFFFGFLPHKPINRRGPLESIMGSENLTILYESPHRIIQLLEEISAIDPIRELFLAKELTKRYQRSFKGEAATLLATLQTIDIRGEWVVIIKGNERSKGEQITQSDIMDLSLPPKQKAKLLAKLTGKTIKEVYETL